MNELSQIQACKQQIIDAINNASLRPSEMILLIENVKFEILLEMRNQEISALQQQMAKPPETE